MRDVRQAWLRTLERRQRRRERALRWWDRLDGVAVGILAAMLAGLGAVGWGAGLLIAAQGWLVEAPLQPVPDERILSSVRDPALDSPVVDIALDGGAQELFLVRANGQLHRLDIETGLWRDVLEPLSDMTGRVEAVRHGCGGEIPVAGCPLGDNLWAITDRGGLARFEGSDWQVVISDTRFQGLDGKPVQQDALKRVAVSDDGRWILLDAGGSGFGLFDGADGRWETLSADTQDRMLGGAEPPSTHLTFADGRFWIGDGSGLAALDPASRTVEAIETVRGAVRDLEADPNGGLLVLSERACDNGHADCLQLIKLHDGQATVRLGEQERYPQLTGLSLFHASEDGRRILAAGEGGLYRYDPSQRSWLRVVDGGIDALWEPGRGTGLYLAQADRVLEFSGGEVAREWSLEQGRVAAFVPRRAGRPSVVLEDGRVFALGSPPSMEPALEPGRSRIPPDAMVSGASLGERVYLIGPQGSMRHDIGARTYETSDRNSTAPILLQSDSSLQEAGGELWAASDRLGRIALLDSGPSAAQPLSVAGEAPLPSGARRLQPDRGGLLTAVQGRAPRRIGVGRPQLPIDLMWPDPPSASSMLGSWQRAEIGGDGRIWFSDDRAVQSYDPVGRKWSEPWSPDLDGSQVEDHALVGNDPFVLGRNGLLIDRLGTPLLGHGPPMPFASANLTDALAEGERIFLGSDQRVVAYDPSRRSLVGAWAAGGPEPRIVSAQDGLPVIHAGDRASFGKTSLAVDGAVVEDVVDGGPGTVVSLQRSGGQRFLVRQRLSESIDSSCLFRRSRPSGDDLIDARVLGDGRIAVATGDGLSFYDPASRTWQPADGMEGGRDVRLHLLGGHLVYSAPGRLGIWRQDELSRPSSCSTEPVRTRNGGLRQAVQSVRAAAVDETRDAIAMLESDGAVDRWSPGSTNSLLPPTTQGPDLKAASRVYRTGQLLVFVVAGDIWTYDLNDRSWTRTRVSGSDGDARAVDLRIAGNVWVVTGRDRTGEALAGQGQIGADSLTLARDLSPPPFPDLPTDPTALTDVAALPSGRWAFLFADRVALLDPVAAGWDSVARFKSAGNDRQLHVVDGRLLVIERNTSDADQYYLFPQSPSGDGPAAEVAAELAPEPGDRLFLDQDGNRLWRLDDRNRLFECGSGSGDDLGTCEQVLNEPVALDPDGIDAASAIEAVHLVHAGGRWRLVDRRARTSKPVTGPIADAPANSEIYELDGDFLVTTPDGRVFRIGTDKTDSGLVARDVQELLRLDQRLLLRMGSHVRVVQSDGMQQGFTPISEQLGVDVSPDEVVALTVDGGGESTALLHDGRLVRRGPDAEPVFDDILSLPGAPDLAGVAAVLAVDHANSEADDTRWLLAKPSSLTLVSRAMCRPDTMPAKTNPESDETRSGTSGKAADPSTEDDLQGAGPGDNDTTAVPRNDEASAPGGAERYQPAQSDPPGDEGSGAGSGLNYGDVREPRDATSESANDLEAAEGGAIEPDPVPCVETRRLAPPEDADAFPYDVRADDDAIVVRFRGRTLRYSLDGPGSNAGATHAWPGRWRVRALQPLDDTVAKLRDGVRLVDGLGPRLDPVTVSARGGAVVSLRTDYGRHDEHVGVPLATAGRAPALDAAWISWDREQQRFRVTGFGDAVTAWTPTQLFPKRRFAGRAPGVAMMLVDGGIAIANDHGVWRYGDADRRRLDTRSVAFQPVVSPTWEGIAHGSFLAPDGRSFDPRAGAFRDDGDRHTVTSGPLRITEALRAGGTEIHLQRTGDTIDPRADRGFLWDRRLDVGWHNGEVRLLTPAGLVHADRLEDALPLPSGPASDARLWTGAGLHLRNSAKDWFALTSTGWQPVSDPTLDWTMVETPRRSWFSTGGVAKIEPASGADRAWARRDGLQFLADDVRALGGGPSGLVLVTGQGTVVAPSFAELARSAKVTDTAPKRDDLHTLRLSPDRSVTTAGRGGAVELWDVQARRWQSAGRNENPWIDRMAADTDLLRVRLTRGRPIVGTSVRTPAGQRANAEISWRAGEHLPFDNVRSIHGDGGTLYVGTRAGLEIRATAPAVTGDLIDTRRGGSGEPDPVVGIGRPARDPGRLVADLAGDSCLELSGTRPSRCAASADLGRRFVGESRFWTWTEGNGVEGRYRDASGQVVGPRLTGPRSGDQGGFPHDTPSDVVRCDGQSFSLWGDGLVTASPAGGFTIGHGTRTFGLSGSLQRFLCQREAAMVGDVRVSAGTYVIGGGQALRFQGNGWTQVSSDGATAVARLAAGDLPWFDGRMRLIRRGGDGFVLQYREPTDTWRDLPWQDDRWAIDDVRSAVRAHGRTWLVTADGLVRARDSGDRLVLDPADVRIAAYPDGRSCRPDRIETLDGNTADVEAVSDEPTRLRCADGRLLQGVLDASAAWDALREVDGPDPFVSRTLVESEDWRWSVTDRTVGELGRIEVEVHGEQVNLTSGRFDADDLLSIGSVDGTILDLATGRGWYRAPAESPGLLASRRPEVRPLDRVTTIDLDRTEAGERVLCLGSGSGSRARYEAANAALEMRDCGEFAGRSGLWQVRELADEVRMTSRPGARFQVQRRLLDGQFEDLKVIGLPIADRSTRKPRTDILVPTALGVSGLTFGQGVMRIHPLPNVDGGRAVFAGPTGGGTVADRQGLRALEGAPVADCPPLDELLRRLPTGVQLIRVQEAVDTAYRITVDLGDKRAEYSGGCGAEDVFRANGRSLSVAASSYFVRHRTRWEAQDTDQVAVAWQPPVARAAVGDELSRDLPEIAAPFQRSLVTKDRLFLLSGGELYGTSADELLKWVFEGAGTQARPGGTTLGGPALEKPKPPEAPAGMTVREMQTALQRLRLYDGAIDGIAGPNTRSAIREFQRRNDFDVTGELTRAQRAVLRSRAESEAVR